MQRSRSYIPEMEKGETASFQVGTTNCDMNRLCEAWCLCDGLAIDGEGDPGYGIPVGGDTEVFTRPYQRFFSGR